MTAVDLISLADQSVRPFESIPVIDVSGLSGDAKNKARIASEIREACIHVGFFYVKNHGIDEAMIASTVDAARRFFELPLEEKMKLDAQQTSHLRGYYPPGQRRLSRESFEIGPDVDASPNIPMSGRNLWPSANVIQDFEEPVSKYYYEVTGFALKLFSAFALALNLPEDYFADKVQNGAATMRLAHYAPQTTVVGEQEPGIIEHTDFQCFTILWQDEHRALQVKNTSGEWIDAHPIPGTFIINIADQLTRMTNGIFKSTIHRVIHTSGGHRYSMPLFFGIDYNTNLEVLPSCVSMSRPTRYEPILVGEYIKRRKTKAYDIK